MKTTQDERNKVELLIRELRQLNNKGLIKMIERGHRPDVIEINDKEVLRGNYVAVGMYVFESD